MGRRQWGNFLPLCVLEHGVTWWLVCLGGSRGAPAAGRRGGMGPRWCRQKQQPSRAGGSLSRSFAVSHLPGSLRGHLTPTCVLGNIVRVKLLSTLQRYPINLHPQSKTTPCLSASLPRNALGTLHSSPASCDAEHASIAMQRVSRE